MIVTPQQGLCKIFATGKTIESSVYGNEIKDHFNGLIRALTQKYGTPDNNFDARLEVLKSKKNSNL